MCIFNLVLEFHLFSYWHSLGQISVMFGDTTNYDKYNMDSVSHIVLCLFLCIIHWLNFIPKAFVVYFINFSVISFCIFSLLERSFLSFFSMHFHRLKRKKGSIFQSISSLQKNSAKVRDRLIMFIKMQFYIVTTELIDLPNTACLISLSHWLKYNCRLSPHCKLSKDGEKCKESQNKTSFITEAPKGKTLQYEKKKNLTKKPTPSPSPSLSVLSQAWHVWWKVCWCP